MALISIKIKEFDNAKGYSGDAKDEALDYRDALNDKIISKMNKYSGSGSSNISQAKKLVNEKRTQLSDKADSFRQLEKDIGTLRTNIVNAETNLTNKIETVVGNFCNKYGLKSERSLFAQFFDWVFGDIDDALAKFFKNISVNFKNWYRYNGGKEFISMVGKVLLVVVAVVALVAAVIALPGLVAALGAAIAAGAGVFAAGMALAGGIAAVITASIGLVTAIVQVGYAMASYGSAASGDPVWGRRYDTHADEETFQSSLRRLGMYTIANVVDVVNTIASVISIVSSAVNLLSNISKAGGLGHFLKQSFANFKTNIGHIKTNSSVLKTLFTGSTKKVLTTIKNSAKIAASVLQLTEDLSNGLGGEAWADFFGDLANVTVSYLHKLGEKDLLVSYRADEYSAKLKEAQRNEKLLTDKHSSKIVTLEEYYDIRQAQHTTETYQKLSDMYSNLNDGLDLGASFGGDIQSMIKDGFDLTADIESYVKINTSTLSNFKFDNGDRLLDSFKPITGFDKLFKKLATI